MTGRTSHGGTLPRGWLTPTPPPPTPENTGRFADLTRRQYRHMYGPHLAAPVRWTTNAFPHRAHYRRYGFILA